jgi:hypothetical protein
MLCLFLGTNFMEMDDYEVNLASPSKEFDDFKSTSEEWIPPCDDELKPVVGKIFDTLTEGGNFIKITHMLLVLACVVRLKQKMNQMEVFSLLKRGF